jgi:hypothetical protein
MSYENYRSCIDACNRCADACDHCSTACLKEDDIAKMAKCIELDMDCAALCRLAASAMARGSDFAPKVCQLCAEICEACVKECGQHDAGHCQSCAKACKECAEMCRSMAA